MTATLSTESLTSIATDVLIVPVVEGESSNPSIEQLDTALRGQLGRELRQQRFRGKEGDELLFQTHGRLPARNLLLCGRTNDGAARAV